MSRLRSAKPAVALRLLAGLLVVASAVQVFAPREGPFSLTTSQADFVAGATFGLAIGLARGLWILRQDN